MSDPELEPSRFCFRRAGSEFALPATSVRTILAAPVVTEVSGAPGSLRGLLAVRGDVVPLLEPDLAARASGTAAAVIIASVGGALALAADEIDGLAGGSPEARAIDPDTLYHSARAAIRRANDGHGPGP